jgi:hypothetical protein
VHSYGVAPAQLARVAKSVVDLCGGKKAADRVLHAYNGKGELNPVRYCAVTKDNLELEILVMTCKVGL